MPALRAESSTVSLPPRERALAKRRAKAIKLRLPPSTSGKSPAKAIRKRGKAPMPPPTLAATRQRRAAANVAYLDRPDGYHIKHVVRRQTPGPAPPIPYLPGEEDIPPSDAESDDSNATLPELARPADPSELNLGFNVASKVEDMLPEMDPDLLDYDAEGEDEDMDVCMEGISLTNCSSYAIPGRTGDGSCSMAGTVPTLSARPVNPLADASEDDIQALFGSLDNLHFGDGPSTSGGGFFPSTNFADTLPGPPDNQLVAHAHYLFGNGLHSTHGSNAWEPATNHSPPQPSEIGRVGYPMQPPTNDLPDLCPPQSRVPTPAPWIAVPEIQAHVLHPPTGPAPPLQSTPSPARNNSGYTLVSSTGIPTGLPFSLRAPTASRPRPHLSTRELVAQVRAQARSPHLRIPPPTGVNDNLHASSPLARHEFGSRALSPTPLRRSLSLPEFLGGTGDNTDDTMSDTEEQDPDAPRPSTPVAWEDTDIGLDESSPIQVTQARCRASRYLNFQRLVPRQVANNPRRIPTLLEVNMNIRRLFKVNRRRQRSRAPISTPETSRRRRNRVLLRSSALTPDQQAVISPMEYRVLLDVVCSNPWPEDREVYLEAAEKYSTALTGISGPDVFTREFLDTVFYRTSGNRGNSLARIEVMMEQEFAVTVVDKPELEQLMSNDQFLYPNYNRDPAQFFCVKALGAALEIIFFKSAKTLGLAFIPELCQRNDPERCAAWHRKLRDRTALEGVPPGAIAFAATQMYWALEKMFIGTNIHFDEDHYRGRWYRYYRALIKLPHLSQLRVDLLDRLKEYYMDHWPSEERDEDDDSFPAW